jgi:TusE/DsrC/DsvC family sulfur relay protein
MKVSVQMPEVDAEGYLVEPQDWSEELANELARQENISLSEEHWIVIRFMREYFDNHQVIPDARFVIKHLNERLEGVSRNKLFELFPYGYVKQACKIAGMKRPRAWSTG